MGVIKQPHVSQVMINTSGMLLLTSNCDLWKCIILMYYIPRKKLDCFLGIFKFPRWLEVCFIGNTLEFGSESFSQIMPSFWMNKGLIFLKTQVTDLRSSPVTNKHFSTLTLGPNTLSRPGFYLWEVFDVVVSTSSSFSHLKSKGKQPKTLYPSIRDWVAVHCSVVS